MFKWHAGGIIRDLFILLFLIIRLCVLSMVLFEKATMTDNNDLSVLYRSFALIQRMQLFANYGHYNVLGAGGRLVR